MSIKNKFLILILLCLSSASLSAQNKQIEKANKKYDLKKYAEAIPLYEQGLKIDDHLRSKTRLAFCYRMINDVTAAENLYGKIVQQKRAKPITWLYYGETLMIKSKYSEAKKWFEKYTEQKPGDAKGWEMLTQLENMQNIKPYFINTKVEVFAHNTDADDSAPLIYNNGIVFSSDRKQGVKLLKQRSGWTGRDFINIYHSPLKEDGTYDSPKPFPKKINATNKNCGNPTFSPDGKTMVFSRNSDWATKRGDYNIMLFSAELTDKGKWKDVEMLSFCNLNANYMHPAFSVTGDTLFYISNRPGGVGGTDIFYSYKKGSKWTRPKNLSEKINTTFNEGYPYVDSDGKLFFCSKGHTGYGGFDIFYSKQDEKGDWQKPVNVGYPINSSHDDISIYVAKDGQSGMFASSRDGGDDDIYSFTTNNLHDGEEAPLVYRPEDDIQVENIIEESLQEEEIAIEENEIAVLESEEVPAVEQTTDVVTIEKAYTEISTEPTASTVPSEVALMKEELKDLIPVELELEAVEEEKVQEAIAKSETIKEKEVTQFEELPIVESRDDLPIPNSTKKNNLDQFLSNLSSRQAGEAVFILEKIKFTPEHFKVNDEIAGQLLPVAEALKRHPAIQFEIGAHTESIGDDKKNMVVSIKRATAIAGYLIKQGIDRKRLQVMGYGETQLINHCSNDVTCDQKEHYKNHRIEIKVIK